MVSTSGEGEGPVDPFLAPLAVIFHPQFWGLDRSCRAYSYISEPLGHVYAIGVREAVTVHWTQAMSFREACVQAAAQWHLFLPQVESGLLSDLQLVVRHEAFGGLHPLSAREGVNGRRFGLAMKGAWWDDWWLYGGIPDDLEGLIRAAASEIRQPHQQEYAPWRRLHALLVPLLGPREEYWFLHWRPYGVHVRYVRQGQVTSLFLGDPQQVSRMTPDEVRAKIPPDVLAHIATKQARQEEQRHAP